MNSSFYVDFSSFLKILWSTTRTHAFLHLQRLGGWRMTCIFINFERLNTLCMQDRGFVSVSWECPRAKVVQRIAQSHPFSLPLSPIPPPETRVGWRATCASRGCTAPAYAQGASVLIAHLHSPRCLIKATRSSLSPVTLRRQPGPDTGQEFRNQPYSRHGANFRWCTLLCKRWIVVTVWFIKLINLSFIIVNWSRL